MSEEAKKVTVDDTTCIGCRHCVEVCPEVFKYNSEKGVAEAVQVPDDCKCDLETIAGECPGGAIIVE